MLKLFNAISKHIALSEELKDALSEKVKAQTFKKKMLIHDADKICRNSYFIEEGILRLYYLKEGKEITEFFGSEQEWMNSPRSFIQQTKDIYYIDAIENTKVLTLNVHDLLFLFKHFPEMERYARLDMGSIFSHVLDRLAIMRFTTPKEKYEHFLASYAEIHHRLPLGMIASYLGIAQETLSRIRNKGICKI